MNMRIMMAELRKIWRPGMVLLLCFLGAIYYYLFMHFDIWYFKSEMFREAEMELATGWIDTYGTTLEPEERLDLERQNAEEIAAFNQQIAAIPEAQAASITDYMSFMAYHEGSRSEAMQQQGKVDMDAEALIWHIIGRTNYPRLQALQLTMVDGIEYLDAIAMLQQHFAAGGTRKHLVLWRQSAGMDGAELFIAGVTTAGA